MDGLCVWQARSCTMTARQQGFRLSVAWNSFNTLICRGAAIYPAEPFQQIPTTRGFFFLERAPWTQNNRTQIPGQIVARPRSSPIVSSIFCIVSTISESEHAAVCDKLFHKVSNQFSHTSHALLRRNDGLWRPLTARRWKTKDKNKGMRRK